MMSVGDSWVGLLYRSSRSVILQAVLSVDLLITRTAQIANFHFNFVLNTLEQAAKFAPNLPAIALSALIRW